jgi:tRNA (cmo5U34)-methyltransferase
MLAVCRRRVEDAGLTSRCSFHEEYIETLTTGEPFNAATSVLVSHFITAYEDRCTFFREIAGRLVSGGYLITADLAADMSMPQFQPLFEVWKRMLAFAGMQQHEIDKYASGLNRDFTVATPKAIESMIEAFGLHAPVQYHQTLLIHSWFARGTD